MKQAGQSCSYHPLAAGAGAAAAAGGLERLVRCTDS